jgi:hypothetical protein
MKQQRVNLQKRIPLKSLEALADVFKDNPYRHSASEISDLTGIAARTVRELLLVYDRRPDLVKQVLADKLSLYQAGKLMRAAPSKWKAQPKTRL